MRVVASLVVLLAALSTAAASARPQSARVVSYLVGAPEFPDPWEGDPPSDGVACDWRIYDPVTRRDFSFVHLAGAPTRIRWDRDFRAVEFKVGRTVYRAPWGPHAVPVVEVQLPVDSS